MERDERWVVTLEYEDGSVVRLDKRFDTHRGAIASARYHERQSYRGLQARNEVTAWEVCRVFNADPVEAWR